MTEHYPETVESETPIVSETSWIAEPVPIKDVTETHAPEFGACMSWLIPAVGAGTPVQILQRRTNRDTGAVSIVTLTGATAVVFNSKLDPLQGANPQGAIFTAVGTRVIEWENQQPLYAIAIGGTALVTVIDEAYAER